MAFFRFFSPCNTFSHDEEYNIICDGCINYPGVVEYEDTCYYEYCPTGTYYDSDYCYDCEDNCIACYDSSDCQVCAEGYYLSTDQDCVTQCNSDEYIDEYQCKECDD